MRGRERTKILKLTRKRILTNSLNRILRLISNLFYTIGYIFYYILFVISGTTFWVVLLYSIFHVSPRMFLHSFYFFQWCYLVLDRKTNITGILLFGLMFSLFYNFTTLRFRQTVMWTILLGFVSCLCLYGSLEIFVNLKWSSQKLILKMVGYQFSYASIVIFNYPHPQQFSERQNKAIQELPILRRMSFLFYIYNLSSAH